MTRATLDNCKCGSIKQAYSKTCRKCYDKSRKILNKPKNNKCKVCQKPCVVIFCSQFCSQEKRRKEHDKKIESDEIVGLKRLKQYLENKNNFCSECNLGNQWNGKSIVLHMDHIDGNPKNTRLSNVRLLCPNCHSQTDTYTGKKRKQK